MTITLPTRNPQPHRRLAMALALSACLTALPVHAPAQPNPSSTGPASSPAASPTNSTAMPPELALPSLGDANSQALSPVAERKLGDRIMRTLLRDPDVIDDPLVLEYVQSVWQSLLAGARARGDINQELDSTYAWSPFLVRDKSVNAFALPGGYIGIHLGLLAMTRSPDELGSVMAHELSHVTQRHIARMMSQAKQTSWVSIATLLLGALAMGSSPEGGQALIMGGQGLAAQGQLNFSRDMEREADRVGFAVMGEAGFAQVGMTQMFEQLQQASRLNDDNSYPYLRTHPLTTERIGEARARLGSEGLALGLPSAAQRSERMQVLALRHALMAARSRVLMDSRSTALQSLLTPSLPPQSDATQVLAQHYTRLVTATQLKDRARADAALADTRKALAALPAAPAREAQRIVALAEIEALLATHRVVQAWALLGDGLGHLPAPLKADGRAETLLRARVALSLPEARNNTAAWQDAATRLQTQVSLQADDASAWALLASLWSPLGQPLRSVRADAEAAAALGDLQGAIDRVDAARKQKRTGVSNADLIELSVMDARAAHWRLIQRDDARDSREGNGP